MTARGPGGRIAPDGRPPQARGVGANARRHDLERPATPGLHDSDLQQGDVQALEQGQRIAPATQQQPAQGQPRGQNGGAQSGGQQQAMGVPDPIEFLGGRQKGTPSQLPGGNQGVSGNRFDTWMPLLERLVAGPGSSGLLAQAYIRQMRALRGGTINRPAVTIDLEGVDEGLEAMVVELEKE